MSVRIRLAGRAVLAAAAVAGLACLGVAGPAAASSPAAPQIHSFSPARGAAGTKVTITGSGFTRVSAVRFRGVAAAFKVRSASKITALVPAMPSASGRIAVATRSGTARSQARLTVTPAVRVSPASGPPGSVVTVSGTGFGASEGVDVFAGASDEALARTSKAGSFGHIRITVPAAAVPGPVWISAKGRGTRLFAQAAFTVSTDWAQFRFSADHTGTNPYENVLSTSDVAGLSPAWSFPTVIASISPAVVGGVVYTGSTQGQVYALDAATGTRLWTFRTKSVQSSPAVADGTVYINSWTGHGFGLTALNAATGAKRWSFSTGRAMDLAAPTVAGHVVYFGSNNDKIYALNAVTGARRWTFATGGPVRSSPAVAAGEVYVGSNDTKLYALNAATGAKLWTFTAPPNPFGNNPGRIQSSPAVVGGVVYVGSNNQHVYAFNAASGAMLWTFATGGVVNSSPAVANGVVYVGSINSNTHNVFALDAATGAKLWTFITGGVVHSSPAVADGVVYIGTADNNVYALDAATGAKLWSFTTGNTVESSPAVANGKVYVGSDDNHLYAFGLPAGPPAEPAQPRNSLHPDYHLPQQR